MYKCVWVCGVIIYVVVIGDDAVKFESLPDDVIVAKAMAVLRSIFGDQTVPEVRVALIHTHHSFILCLPPSLSPSPPFSLAQGDTCH